MMSTAGPVVLEQIRVALSLRQPWAWLVVHGGKGIENRRWNTKYRGDFLVHAAKGMTHDEYDDAADFAACVEPDLVLPKFELLERGGIVGRARLVDVIDPCRVPPLASTCSHPWHMPEQYGFVLDNVGTLSFRPLRGALGFFKVSPMLPGGAGEGRDAK